MSPRPDAQGPDTQRTDTQSPVTQDPLIAIEPEGAGVTDAPAATDPSRAARPTRRRWAVFGPLAVLLLLAAYCIAVAVGPLPAAALTGFTNSAHPHSALTGTTSAASTTRTVREAAVQPAFPAWGGDAAVSEIGRDGMLVQTGSDQSVPIASMTKTITSLVLLAAHPLTATDDGPTITYTQNDVDILDQEQAEDGSWAPVVAGEQLTLKQSLEAMLLPSANNYALSLAIWNSGSVAAFVATANTWLSAHGFTNTHMTDPSGLDPGTVSNATDLVGIGKLVMANPVLAGIVGTTSVTLAGAGEVDNTNALLGTAGIDGIKTGWTDPAGHCLMFAASVKLHGHPVRLVGVVTGAPDYGSLWAAVPTLLQSVEAGFHDVTVAPTTTDYGSYRSAWGDAATLRSAQSGSMSVFSDAPITETVHTTPVTLAKPGTVVGTVTYTSGTSASGRQKVTRDLTVSHAITDPGFWWRFTHPLSLF
jgi:D-alanyl-D-alanine carboxypeptidase (penicillin-binding protein 5/6)